MSHTRRMEKTQVVVMVFVFFGLLAVAIPLICSQLVPKIQVQSFDAPGRSMVSFEGAGSYIIYYEQFLDDDKEVQDKENNALKQLTIEVSKSDVNRGWPLSLRAARDEHLYRLGRRKGISIYTFDVKVPGEYTVKTYYKSGNGPDLRLSMGHGTLNSRAIRMTIIVLIALVSISTIVTMIFFVIKIAGS
ncbi:MAG: hypothetical protein KBC91_03435 [Candidatus Omnitrophica bacterium]|nr:hypothetical protein [Candidatus Omnitrophota bacterium]